jgi:lipopolysaccharide transport protein LptA
VQRLKSNLGINFLAFFVIVFCCEILFFVLDNQALAAQNSKPESPTRIRSDIIDIKRKSQTINFFSNVVVEKDDSSLLADKMVVFYNEKKDQDSQNNDEKKGSIKRIEARENVRIFSEEFIASGSYGYYDPKKNIFVLEKNVIVNNGTSIASGDKFIYNLQTKKGNFVGPKDETSITGNGGDKRVVVVIGNDLEDQNQEMKTSKKQKNAKNSQR